MILAGPRVNTLIHLKGTNMYITDTEVTFTFLKPSRPSYKQKPLIFGLLLQAISVLQPH